MQSHKESVTLQQCRGNAHAIAGQEKISRCLKDHANPHAMLSMEEQLLMIAWQAW